MFLARASLPVGRVCAAVGPGAEGTAASLGVGGVVGAAGVDGSATGAAGFGSRLG